MYPTHVTLDGRSAGLVFIVLCIEYNSIKYISWNEWQVSQLAKSLFYVLNNFKDYKLYNEDTLLLQSFEINVPSRNRNIIQNIYIGDKKNTLT